MEQKIFNSVIYGIVGGAAGGFLYKELLTYSGNRNTDILRDLRPLTKYYTSVGGIFGIVFSCIYGYTNKPLVKLFM